MLTATDAIECAGTTGQTLVEIALILPLFLMVLVGIIVLGIGVFYQQQMTMPPERRLVTRRSTRQRRVARPFGTSRGSALLPPPTV